MNYSGIITACGNVAGPNFETTVFPFILRGNRLIGIDSATCPMTLREKVWNNFSEKWKLKNLDNICKIIDLYRLDNEIKKILSGKQIGRVIVKI
jgi:NADPH:quinone reductase-like Zn-dependent oxidoreductase